MCVIYMKTKRHYNMVMLFPCVNLTSAAIRRSPHPTTRAYPRKYLTFIFTLFFVILILSCHYPLPLPLLHRRSSVQIKLDVHVIFYYFCQIAPYIMQALGSIFQATITIRLVTTSNHARDKDPDPGSGSENPDLYLK